MLASQAAYSSSSFASSSSTTTAAESLPSTQTPFLVTPLEWYAGQGLITKEAVVLSRPRHSRATTGASATVDTIPRWPALATTPVVDTLHSGPPPSVLLSQEVATQASTSSLGKEDIEEGHTGEDKNARCLPSLSAWLASSSSSSPLPSKLLVHSSLAAWQQHHCANKQEQQHHHQHQQRQHQGGQQWVGTEKVELWRKQGQQVKQYSNFMMVNQQDEAEDDVVAAIRSLHMLRKNARRADEDVGTVTSTMDNSKCARLY